MEPCVPDSSSDEIMRFLAIRFSIGARSTDLSPGVVPFGFDWYALDGLESGVASVNPFETLIVRNLSSGRLGGFLTYNT